MAGIYIHIPFCRQACHYCNFHFSTNLKRVDEVMSAIIGEIHIHKNYLNDIVSTIYFGGGTPSVIDPSYLTKIMNSLKESFRIDPIEITLECNPDDISSEKLAMWKDIGINRLSLGIQSFHDHHLKWMNRSHDSKQALNSLDQIQTAGFENYTIDLIFGFAGLIQSELEENLQIVTDLAIPHISAYGLTIEPKTALEYQRRKHIYIPLSDEEINAQMSLVMNTLSERGYEQYEISNYALPGRRAVHNSNYWKGMPYLGIGPGAHSFDGNSRQWNVANNQKYIQLMRQGKAFHKQEQLSSIDRYNEFVMTSMRMAEGINMLELQDQHPEYYNHFIHEIEPFKGVEVTEHDGFISLSNKGKFMADHVISMLFYTEN